MYLNSQNRPARVIPWISLTITWDVFESIPDITHHFIGMFNYNMGCI